ncbi:cardiolipin synthase [Solibacillus cecembensis]|uniref:cardiolipin synthase n=1 Tax=Solibacillus cecembensis TaxID=459347 RepID=UPI003A9BFE74
MTFTGIFTISLYALNFLFALFVVFISRKSPSSAWAWLFVLFFIPIVGFVFYLLFGRNLRKKNFVRWMTINQNESLPVFKEQQKKIDENTYEFPNAVTKEHQQLIQMNVDYNQALLSAHNEVEIFSEGKDKFTALIKDIEQAKQSIHMQYYIFKMDKVGRSIYDALVLKAQQGVEVKVIYDDLGSRKLMKKHFQELIDAGGEVEAFFSSYFTLLNPRINFRNHRKLVILDGQIGYIGGFNVGEEYAGLDEKIGYWRDTHLKIQGHSVYSMQAHFIFDWHQARNEMLEQTDMKYFPSFHVENLLPVQIVSSGPDTEYESIKNSYIRMILSAKRYIYIQSPYFVPDEAFLHAIQIAASSGVDVRIMTPAVTDHPFVYGANSAYGGEMLRHGGRIFRYEKGFLHAKMMVIDDEITMIGTANIDVRSFSLNFEINAILFDEALTIKCRTLFEQDQQNSFEMTPALYEQRSNWTKVREAVSRLISPIL